MGVFVLCVGPRSGPGEGEGEGRGQGHVVARAPSSEGLRVGGSLAGGFSHR